MCANSKGSGETARMRMLAWAFAGRLCDKYHNLMSWLKSRCSISLRPFKLSKPWSGNHAVTAKFFQLFPNSLLDRYWLVSRHFFLNAILHHLYRHQAKKKKSCVYCNPNDPLYTPSLSPPPPRPLTCFFFFFTFSKYCFKRKQKSFTLISKEIKKKKTSS